MKWQIPAKTFLIGEYAAIAGKSAILLTTTPCFEFIFHQSPHPSEKIHPQSPAGLWLEKHLGAQKEYLQWHDPYPFRGGLGASSGQFIASYLATCFLQQKKNTVHDMLEEYYRLAWNGQGLRPSGYDVIAQSQQNCVYINQNKNLIEIMPWSFPDIGFLLLHTRQKLATHHHLQQRLVLSPADIQVLSSLAEDAKIAFAHKDSKQLVDIINNSHQQLSAMGLVASHSLELIHRIKQNPRILAVKGCGAMGADVVLILSHVSDITAIAESLSTAGLTPFASHRDLYTPDPSKGELSPFEGSKVYQQPGYFEKSGSI